MANATLDQEPKNWRVQKPTWLGRKRRVRQNDSPGKHGQARQRTTVVKIILNHVLRDGRLVTYLVMHA